MESLRLACFPVEWWGEDGRTKEAGGKFGANAGTSASGLCVSGAPGLRAGAGRIPEAAQGFLPLGEGSR